MQHSEPMNEARYRIAQLTDLPTIVQIYNSIVAGRMVTADLEPVSVESRLAWFHAHSAEKRPLWVLENSEENIIAWLSFQSFYGRPAYDGTVEVSIYIATDHRGKGLGRKILEFCVEQAPNFNIHTLLGFIFAHNTPSMRLFETFGFEPWGHLPEVAEIDGNKVDLMILGYRIQE